ncbi:hypothetical protein EZJ19_14390 [Parasulfuritortus cantonensis]|uniref:Uncharacterized protein n=1 Tax=Parasulfuritortus cantonensis TaxID=2528202 RepID=A0A4R1B1E4_9PROT|nr:hypothetical protein [Parasulfuritortus cantonensis]TCJ11842.1 hypothetical protein EZJ19_14390 [Parasulfuritortus cantonensis]
MAARADMLASLALHNLFVACGFAANVARAENEYAGKPLGVFWEEVLHNALGVAALTVTFLDSLANELAYEGSVLAPRRGGPVPVPDSGAMVEGVLQKYSTALTIHAGKRLDYEAPAVRNADALIRLRNEVMRPRSDWTVGDKISHDALAEALRDRFAPSTLVSDTSLLPRAWASYSFAKWAIRTSVEFVDYIYGELGETSPLESVRPRLAGLCRAAL